jgi:hypothetical protein
MMAARGWVVLPKVGDGVNLDCGCERDSTYKFPCTFLKEVAEFACSGAPGPASSRLGATLVARVRLFAAGWGCVELPCSLRNLRAAHQRIAGRPPMQTQIALLLEPCQSPFMRARSLVGSVHSPPVARVIGRLKVRTGFIGALSSGPFASCG